jgi:hypothetical protein
MLVLSLAMVACAASQKPAPAAPMPPMPAPKERPSAPTSPKPKGPTINITFKLTPASAAWARMPLDDDEVAANFQAKLENKATEAWYAVQAVTVPAQESTFETFAMRVHRSAARSGLETSALTFAPDGMSASFYYEEYGSDARGKAFLLKKPGTSVALLVQSMWPLGAQEVTLPEVDAMNASLDYTVTKK